MTSSIDALPLNALRAFCEVARLQHVTHAANSLGVSQSAISRHVAQLEIFMGAPLLERRGRNVMLTDIGRQLATAVSAPFSEIEFSIQLLRRRQQKEAQRLVVRTSLPTFAFTSLIPSLSEFSKLHNDVPVDVLTSTTPQELLGNFDVLISRDLSLPPPMHEWTICEENIVCVGAPDVVKTVAKLGYLAKPICTVNSRPDILPTWLNAMGLQENNIKLGARYAHHYMAIPATIAGSGLLIVPEIVAMDYIAKDLLVVVEDSRIKTGMKYSAFASDRSSFPDLAKSFCRWLMRMHKNANTMQI